MREYIDQKMLQHLKTLSKKDNDEKNIMIIENMKLNDMPVRIEAPPHGLPLNRE